MPELFDEVIRHSGDVALGTAAGDDHAVGEAAFPVEVDDGDVRGLVVVERG